MHTYEEAKLMASVSAAELPLSQLSCRPFDVIAREFSVCNSCLELDHTTERLFLKGKLGFNSCSLVGGSLSRADTALHECHDSLKPSDVRSQVDHGVGTRNH